MHFFYGYIFQLVAERDALHPLLAICTLFLGGYPFFSHSFPRSALYRYMDRTGTLCTDTGLDRNVRFGFHHYYVPYQ